MRCAGDNRTSTAPVASIGVSCPGAACAKCRAPSSAWSPTWSQTSTRRAMVNLPARRKRLCRKLQRGERGGTKRWSERAACWSSSSSGARTSEAAELLVNASFDRLARGCLPRVSSDGYDAYTQPLCEQVKAVTLYPLWWALTRKGRPGRPPKPTIIPDPALIYGQVVKEREGRRVVRVEKRLVLGPRRLSWRTLRPLCWSGRTGRRARATAIWCARPTPLLRPCRTWTTNVRWISLLQFLPQAPVLPRLDASDEARTDRSRLVGGRGVGLPERCPVMNPNVTRPLPENASLEQASKKSAERYLRFCDSPESTVLFEQRVRCGKANCRCARGELHEGILLLYAHR